MTKSAFKASLSAALLCSVAGCVSAPVESASSAAEYSAATLPDDPGNYLRAYYAQQDADLPKASTGAVLDTSRALTRIAFGSCNHQSRSQHMWAQIAAKNPQLFLFLGDNIYGDRGWEGDAELTSLRDAYALQASHPEFINFRAQVPMVVTWDDHDYGLNDAGGNFAFRQHAETIYETFWGASEEVKSRPGIYDSMMVGPAGQRVQIITLDTRFFRSPLKSMPEQAERPPLGSNIADTDPSKTMLGDAQWAWLAQELAKPADLRLIVSSIQVLTEAHGFEKWGNFPLEKSKLFSALKARTGGDILLLSGDRHSGAIYKDAPKDLGETVWEFTSSSLNLAFVSADASEREPDPRRTSPMVSQENFGIIDIDWASKAVKLQLHDAKGQPITGQVVSYK